MRNHNSANDAGVDLIGKERNAGVLGVPARLCLGGLGALAPPPPPPFCVLETMRGVSMARTERHREALPCGTDGHAYLSAHQKSAESALTSAVNEMLHAKPADPVSFLAERLAVISMVTAVHREALPCGPDGEAYLSAHQESVESALTSVVNEMLHAKPTNPVSFLAVQLATRASGGATADRVGTLSPEEPGDKKAAPWLDSSYHKNVAKNLDTEPNGLQGVDTAGPERSLSLKALPKELMELLQRIDVDSNGTIKWEEFLTFALHSGTGYERIGQLWGLLLHGKANSIVAELQAMQSPPQVRKSPAPSRAPLLRVASTCADSSPWHGEQCGACLLCFRFAAKR